MALEFDCPHCNQHLSVDPSAAGQPTQCPTCSGAITIPAQEPVCPPANPVQGVIYCPQCGHKNLENNYQCIGCGTHLHEKPQTGYVAGDDSTMGGLIPVKNPKALFAYYLGIFSLIPCVGIPLGIAAVVLGIMGLQFASLHPESRGKIHAWVGVILGAISTVVYGLLMMLSLIAS